MRYLLTVWNDSFTKRGGEKYHHSTYDEAFGHALDIEDIWISLDQHRLLRYEIYDKQTKKIIKSR